MDHLYRLILIDGDSRRRAAISHLLVGSGIHVEPFETVAEVARRWPRSGVILVHDDDGLAVADLVAAMARDAHWLPLIAFAQAPKIDQVVRTVLAGASTFLEWPFDCDQARTALKAAHDSHDELGPLRLREANARSRIKRLTPREREVLTGVASGLSNRLIGEQLSISPRTVEIHRANMLNKIGASHTSEAIRVAIEAALVS